MANMNIFNGSAFSTTSLSGAVDKMDYVPSLLGSLNLFEAMPVRTHDLWVDRRDGETVLIPTSPMGAPPAELVKDTRTAVPLRTTRLVKGFTLYATEVQGIRAFGSESESMQVQAEYLRRMQRIRQDMELTHEHHRLGALQGKLLDSDGTTVIYNYFTEFGETEATAISFALATATTDVRGKCAEVIRAMTRAARGAMTPGTTVHALAGDEFYDALISHPNVEKAYLNWNAASDLTQNKAFGAFTFGGITWHNYRGTDDNSTVAVPTDEAKFFPVGATGIFKKAMGPLESIEYANTAGRDTYAMNIRDMDRNFWTRGEVYSYPLYFCQRPEVLRKATA
jgi:hypothetical protein